MGMKDFATQAKIIRVEMDKAEANAINLSAKKIETFEGLKKLAGEGQPNQSMGLEVENQSKLPKPEDQICKPE